MPHPPTCDCKFCAERRVAEFEAQKHDPLDANGIPRSAKGKDGLGAAFTVGDHLTEALAALDKGWIPTVRWHLLAAKELRESPLAPAVQGISLSTEQFQQLLSHFATPNGGT